MEKNNETLVVENAPLEMCKTKDEKKKRRSLVGVLLACMFAIGIFAFGSQKMASHSIITLDVNPSIEIETNAFGKVVAVRGVNEDAKAVLEGYTITDNDLDDVLEDVMDRLILNGYFEKKDNDILVSVTDDSMAQENLGKINSYIAQKIAQYKDDISIHGYVAKGTGEDKAAAKEANVSLGKYLLAKKLANGDDALLKELLALPVSDIIKYAKAKDIDVDDVLDNDEEDDANEEEETVPSNAKTTKEEAVRLALESLGGGKLVKVEYDDGFYEVTIRLGDDKYKYNVDVFNGSVYLDDVDKGEYKESSEQGKEEKITKDAAIALAKAYAGGGEVKKCSKDGNVYEVKILLNGKIYEYEVNVFTGAVVLEDAEDTHEESRQDKDKDDDDEKDDDEKDDDEKEDDHKDDEQEDDEYEEDGEDND